MYSTQALARLAALLARAAAFLHSFLRQIVRRFCCSVRFASGTMRAKLLLQKSQLTSRTNGLPSARLCWLTILIASSRVIARALFYNKRLRRIWAADSRKWTSVPVNLLKLSSAMARPGHRPAPARPGPRPGHRPGVGGPPVPEWLL